MDVKDKVAEVIKSIKKDPQIGEKFKSDPVGTIEALLGVDLPDGMVQQVVAGVKAKLAGKEAGGLLGKIKGAFK
ncbi:MAG: hypothetical protein KBA30_10215 [Clostridia bacterium]|nr:hypothetical protein [Clostridia bacterium]